MNISPSPDRTLVVGTYVGIAPRGRIASQVPLRWPNKAAGAVLDYSLDFTSYLAAMGNDTILAVIPAVTPSHVGSIAVNAVQIAGAVVTFLLAQGIAGEDYALLVAVRLASGRAAMIEAGIYAEVSALPLPTPVYVLGPASAITNTAGAPITTDAGAVITTDGAAPLQAGSAYVAPTPPAVAPAPTVSGTAAAVISGYTAVAITAAGLVAADSMNVGLSGAVIGVALNGANAGGAVLVEDQGPVSFNGWAWTPGQPVFVGAGGVLTQSAPIAGFLQIIGTAESATALIVSLEPPIIL